MAFRLEEICRRIGGRLEGDGERIIRGVNALEAAGDSEITYAQSGRYHAQASAGGAAALIVGEDFPGMPGRNLLRVAQPKLAFVRVMEMFAPPPEPTGIHPDASIAQGAELAQQVSVGACAVIAAGARVGARTIIEPGAYIGPGVSIGEDCRIGPNAVLMQGVSIGDRVGIFGGAVIGGDGYGYVWLGDHHHKVPQLGGVRIDDDVEIGCNTCIDRATLGVTRIRRGTKIDNLVQIAHNNDIGEDVIMTGQVGTAGTVTVKNRAVFGGQAGIADHKTIGEGAQIGAKTGVTRDVAPGETVWGMPSRPMRQILRELAHLARLPELAQRFKAREKELDELRERVAELERRLPADRRQD